MVDSLPVTLLVGTVLGFLSGLGVGGGSLLILWLTAVLGADPLAARSINLLFFLPSAVIACLFRLKEGRLRWNIILPALIAGCAAAILCSLLAGALDVTVMKKLFGILLLAAGARELFRR